MIRPADPLQDAAACAAIYAPYVTGSVISFETEPPSETEMAGRIERAHVWLVEEDGGEVVGYAYGSPHAERAAYRWAADVSVYVAGAHHRRGVGRRLYETLFVRLRAIGVQVACAGTTLPNPGSVGLHEALGFEPVGVYRQIGWKDGAWHDVGWWQLRLLSADGGPPAELSRRP